MQVLFGVTAILLIFFAGLIPFILGIVGLVIVKVRKKNGKTTSKAITPLSIVAIILSVVIMAFPVSFFGMIFLSNVMLQDNVTITDIVIEEYGYQDERFTADGVVYVVCDDLSTDYYHTKADAVFTYKYGDSIFERSQIGNYYAVDNPYGFDLVTDGSGALFCPESQYDAVMKQFSDAEGCYWKVYGKLLSKEASEMFDMFIDDPAVRGIELTLKERDCESWSELCKMSADGVIEVFDYEDFHQVLIYDGKVYYIRDYEYAENSNDVKFILVPMPTVIADEILNAYNDYND